MNILIAGIFNHNSYSRGIMPNVLQTKIDDHPEANIFYLTNSKSFEICYFNIEKRPEICYRCSRSAHNTLKLIKGKFTHIKISDLITSDDEKMSSAYFEYKEVVSFDHFYENFEVGQATLSTYISRTRDRDLLNVDQPFVKELAVNALSLYFAVRRFIVENNITVVYNFNGRQEYVRAIMRAALAEGVNCFNVERTRLKGYIDYYHNTLPHDPVYKSLLVEKYWNESSSPEEVKKKQGAAFFHRQRAGESVVFPSYIGRMKEGKVPEFLNNNKNLVVFTSSDDETIALGEWYQNPFFKNQNDGLLFLCNLIGKEFKDYNLIIRMHPNLKGLDFAFVREILNLHQMFPNIYIIEPESSIDTYALMDLADKLITFGSTTGLEANFIQKPVILLGIGLFYHANYAHIPKNRNEIRDLIRTNLKPKPLLPTLKVGYYLTQGGKKTRYYYEEEMGAGVYFKGKRIPFLTFVQKSKAKFIHLKTSFL